NPNQLAPVVLRNDARRARAEKRIENNASPASVVTFTLPGRFPSDGINNRTAGPPVTRFGYRFFPQVLAVILFTVPPSFFVYCFPFRHPRPPRTAMRTRLFRRSRQNARLDKVRREDRKMRAFKRFCRDGPDGALVAAFGVSSARSSFK